MRGLGENFYDVYVKPYVTAAVDTAAINATAALLVSRGMSAEEASRTAYQVVTGEPFPVLTQQGFFDRTVFGIKMPLIVTGSLIVLLGYFFYTGKK